MRRETKPKPRQDMRNETNSIIFPDSISFIVMAWDEVKSYERFFV